MGDFNQEKSVSLYYLHPSDNSGAIISTTTLKGENYDKWARSMKGALRAKKKLGYVLSSVPRQNDDSPDLEDWWIVNSMIVSWIFNTIESSLRSTITYMESAKDLWDDLQQRFSIGNGPRIYQLESDLQACKQNGVTIMAYYGQLKKLWDDIGDYDAVPPCCCNGCSCNMIKTLARKREEEKVYQFLMRLDDSTYGSVRSTILTRDPLPTLNQTYSLIMQEERVRIMSKKEERNDGMSLAVRAQPTTKFDSRTEGRNKVNCGHCLKSGHDAGSYFQLVGYPNWWEDRPRGLGRGNGRGKTGQFSTPVASRGTGRDGTARANSIMGVATEGSAVATTTIEGIPGSTTSNSQCWLTFYTHKP